MGGSKKTVFFLTIVISVALTSFFIYQDGPVISRPPGFFAWDPCQPKTGLLSDTHPLFESNEDFLVPYLRKGGLPAQRGVGVRREGLDPLERYLFRQPPTTDSRCLPEELNSTVHIINPRDRLIVGDTVQLRVDLYTGYGTRRHSGGDDVRLWLKSVKGNTSMAVKVTDLNNGSYIGYAVLKWPGMTLVRASLAHPQEYLRGLAEMLHTIGNVRWSTDSFHNTKGTKEKTLCSPLAPIPGFAKICNLTSRNGDRSWFCSHPVSEGLNCSHWSKTTNMLYLSDTQWPITSVVKPFIAKLRKCCKNVTLPLRLISNNISINVKQGARKKPPALPPCWSIPRRETWYRSSRTGWFQNRAWQSDTCSLPDLTHQRILNCMRNTTLVLHGDSNQRLWWDTIHGFLPCSYLRQDGQWHAPRLCQNHNLSSTLMFFTHAMPFTPGSHADLVTVSLPRALDKLLHYTPQGGKAVYVLHYYRHFTTYSLHVYRQRVREARRTLEKFVQLHPNVKVIIRAPHACYQSRHNGRTIIGDEVVAAYTEVWKEEFVGLEDKVWFLDLWDATVAAENVLIHPGPSVTKELLKVLFGYFCEGNM